MAVRIYLDTQDYIRFHAHNQGKIADVFRFLCERVDSGQVEVFYSYFIIAEFLTDYTPEYREDRLRRAQLLKRLCKTNALGFPGRSFLKTPYSLDGDWLPELDYVGLIEKGIREELEPQIARLPRKQRRQLKRKKFPLKEIIHSTPSIYSRSLRERDFPFPLPDSFIQTNLFMQYLCGEVSKARMDREFKSLFFNLEKFIQLWYEYENKGNFLTESIRDQARSFVGLVEKFKILLGNLNTQKKALKGIEDTLRQNSLYGNFKPQIEESKLLFRKIGSLDFDYVKSLLTDTDIFSVIPEEFLKLVISYVRYSVMESRNPTDSDTGDLMHGMYLPYCDLWRTDKSFAKILIRQKVPGYEAVVNDLLDLPERVDRKLSQ